MPEKEQSQHATKRLFHVSSQPSEPTDLENPCTHANKAVQRHLYRAIFHMDCFPYSLFGLPPTLLILKSTCTVLFFLAYINMSKYEVDVF